MTTIELSPEAEKRLDALAAETGQEKAVLLSMAIENGIDDIADYFNASRVLERIRKGEEKTSSARQVREELGLGD